MRLGSLTRPELIFSRLRETDRDGVLRSLADRIAQASDITDADRLFRRLLEREQLGSTAIGGGVAIPHCKFRRLDRVVLAVGVVPDGIDFDAADGQPVKLVFVIASPEKAPTEHLKALAAISKWVQDSSHVKRLLETPDSEAIYELLNEDGAP